MKALFRKISGLSHLPIHIILVALVAWPSLSALADEGMWLPLLLNRNIAAMQKMGCKLSAEQIYSVNQACIKDAIICLDHGSCSGSIISQKGLLITNHHCGYGAIAGQSSVEHDYLTEGFWAMRNEEELPIEGKTVSFLIRMEDVSARVLQGVHSDMDETTRHNTIQSAIDSIEEEAVANNTYDARVESMFEGNQYFLFVYNTFRDVRLVGAPPSAIGKFGGETDNWMWPRHTGDFCLLRVYSGPDGNPADFSKSNVPLVPKYSLPISLKGYHEGDFTFLMGYPGSTDRYLTSGGIAEKLNLTNPADIKSKWTKMEAMKPYMDQDDATRIAYAENYAYLANFWKKSLQESKALRKLNVYDARKAQEADFEAWLATHPAEGAKFGNVLPAFDTVYLHNANTRAPEALSWAVEMLMGSKVLENAYKSADLLNAFGTDKFDEKLASMRSRLPGMYEGFNPLVEKSILNQMLLKYYNNTAPAFHPSVYSVIVKKYHGHVDEFVSALFKKSIFASAESLNKFLDHPRKKTFQNDLAFVAAASFINSYVLARTTLDADEETFNKARRDYIAGQQSMDTERLWYPDANSTMRLTYGSVEPYKPADALLCDYFTTLSGVMEKEDTTNQEFIVPQRLKDLYNAHDYGNYDENGQIQVCFLTTHDITGGNSGSGVMNAKGEMIGVAFDGNSESMSSDIKYNEELQRTICVDIRYVLFVVDKFAGAGYLLDEMQFAGK